MTRRFYEIISDLSLDVAAGSAASSLMICRLLQVQMPFCWWIGLPAVVWTIYLAEHFMDGQNVSIKSGRHFLVLKHGKILLVSSIVPAVLSVFFMPRPLIIGGVLLAIAVIIAYLFLKNRGKEWWTGLFYVIGVSFGPVVLSKDPLPVSFWLFEAAFLCTAWMNLLLFSFFDHEYDSVNHFYSFSTFHGKETVRKVTYLCSVLGFLALGLYFLMDGYLLSGLFLLTIWMIHFFMLIYSNWFKQYSRYRFIGDGCFCLPFFLLFSP